MCAPPTNSRASILKLEKYHFRLEALSQKSSLSSIATVKHPILRSRHNLPLIVPSFVVNSHNRVAEPAALLRVVNRLPLPVVEQFNAFALKDLPESFSERSNVNDAFAHHCNQSLMYERINSLKPGETSIAFSKGK